MSMNGKPPPTRDELLDRMVNAVMAQTQAVTRATDALMRSSDMFGTINRRLDNIEHKTEGSAVLKAAGHELAKEWDDSPKSAIVGGVKQVGKWQWRVFIGLAIVLVAAAAAGAVFLTVWKVVHAG